MWFLANHIFGKPDPAVGVYEDADADAVEGGAGEVNEVPAVGSLVHHAFLDVVDAAPRCGIGTRLCNVFAAVGVAREALVGDAHTLVFTVGAGVTEAAVGHVPAMEARATSQGCVPGERVETACCPVTVDEGK